MSDTQNFNEWEACAFEVESEFGTQVDWEERFYVCPECGEPVYECDYPNPETLCPICGFDW